MTDESAKGPASEGGKGDGEGVVVPPPKRKARRKRGETELDPEMKRLVRAVGRDKLVPDTTAIERHYARSLRFRHLIIEYLLENDGSSWSDLAELHARAANYAGCASQTAARWVYQLTRVEGPFRLLEAVDHWVLVRRE